jgi:hypothetical protein
MSSPDQLLLTGLAEIAPAQRAELVRVLGEMGISYEPCDFETAGDQVTQTDLARFGNTHYYPRAISTMTWNALRPGLRETSFNKAGIALVDTRPGKPLPEGPWDWDFNRFVLSYPSLREAVTSGEIEDARQIGLKAQRFLAAYVEYRDSLQPPFDDDTVSSS